MLGPSPTTEGPNMKATLNGQQVAASDDIVEVGRLPVLSPICRPHGMAGESAEDRP